MHPAIPSVRTARCKRLIDVERRFSIRHIRGQHLSISVHLSPYLLAARERERPNLERTPAAPVGDTQKLVGSRDTQKLLLRASRPSDGDSSIVKHPAQRALFKIYLMKLREQHRQVLA